MDPMSSTLLVTITSSSEKITLNHGSPVARGPATPPKPANREKRTIASAGDKRSRRRHREGKGRSRDGIFRHRMNHGNSLAHRSSVSTYRDEDNDNYGLLRPLTRETTRSLWGSESARGNASRRGSVLEGIDKDMQLGPIKRHEEIRSIDDLERVRDQRSKGEEYLRSALSVIGTLATDITRRLDYAYYGLLEKIAALNLTISSFQELSDSTSKLFDDFQQETTGLERDIRKQIGDLKAFQPQMQRIEALEERMRANKTRSKALSNRLEAMRNEIERWDKREMEWQMRTNQRLRIFWGFVFAVILAILVALVIQHWPTEERPSGLRTLPKALKLANYSCRIPLPKQHDALVSGSPKDELAWSLDPSNLNPSSPHTAPGYTGTSSETDEAVTPTDYYPLRILDVL